MAKRLISAKLFLLSLYASFSLLAQYDNSFGVNGSARFNFLSNYGSEVPLKVIRQSDGKLMVAGYIEPGIGNAVGFLARYNADGTRDLTFSGKGFVTLSNGSGDMIIHDVLQTASGYVYVGENFNGSVQEGIWGVFDVNGFSNSMFIHNAAPLLKSTAFLTVHETSEGKYVIAGYTYDALDKKQLMIAKLASDGSVDGSFFSTGFYVANETTDNQALSTFFYSDTLVVAGYIDSGTDTAFVTRFAVSAAGQIDGSFNGGALAKKFYGDDALPRGVVATDAREVIIGVTYGTAGSYNISLNKLNSSGAWDVAFGGGSGEVLLDLGYNDEINGLTLLSTGSVFFSGGSVTPPTPMQQEQFYYGTITSAGALVTQFLMDVGNFTETATCAVEDDDGSVYVVGNSGFPADVRILKLLPSYSVDVLFGTNGFVGDYYLDGTEVTGGSVVAPDGKIVVVGKTPDATDNLIPSILRLNANGSLDNTLGSGGKLQTGVVPGENYTTVEVNAGGEIFAIGTADNGVGTNTSLLIEKYSETGSLVPSYNTSGIVVYNYNDSIEDIVASALQTDGKLVLAGIVISGGNRMVTLFRYNTDGTLDGTFAAGGIFQSNVRSSDLRYMDVIMQVDGKILWFGSNDNTVNNTHDFSVFRLNSDGTLDSGFGVNGYFQRDYGQDDILISGNTDLKGNIYMTGARQQAGVYQTALLRLKPDGTLDSTTFATNGIFSNSFGGDLTLGMGVFPLANEIIVGAYVDSIFYALSFDTTGALNSLYDGDGIVEGNFFPQFEGTSINYSGNALYLSYNSSSIMSDIVVDKFKYTPTITGGGTNNGLSPGLTINDLNKVYGNPAFSMVATSASTAPITYQVSGCATYDTTSKLISITCAGTAIISVTQPAFGTYDADTDSAVIIIAKATPSVVFNNQGAVVGDATFDLLYSTTSDAAFPIFTSPTTSAFSLAQSGALTPLASGSALVTIQIPETTNYLSVSASATIVVYTVPVPPNANPVTVNAFIGDTTKFNLLDYAIGKSAPLNPREIDLDPEQDGIQSKYASPAYGFFSVDTNGVLTFIPIYGFQGEAVISYSIGDDRGLRSEAAELRFVYTLPNPELTPELETREVFTPNGDGFNDAFVIAFLDNTIKNTFVVYDRNGHEVFKSEEYKNDWEGIDNSGNKLDSGMYYYYFNDELKRSTRGAFLIRR